MMPSKKKLAKIPMAIDKKKATEIMLLSPQENEHKLKEVWKLASYITPNEKDIPEITKNAEAGVSAQAQYLYGCYLEKAKQDIVKATHYYFKAAQQNHPQALLNLANIFSSGNVVKKDIKQVLFYLNHPAVKENHFALNLLGDLYLYGDEVPQNLPYASTLFQKAAQCQPPSIKAMLRLGSFYEYGLLGFEKDQNQAIEYYSKAVAYSSITTEHPHFYLGQLYLNKQKTSKKAFTIFQEGYAKHCMYSGTYLARCYIEGYGTTVNIKKGIELLNSFVNKKIPPAIYYYGLFLLKGFQNVIPKNQDKAFHYLDEAAKLGYSDALFFHARRHDTTHPENITTDKIINNEGLNKEMLEDLDRIFNIYRCTALNGNVNAMYELGLCYLSSRMTSQNELLGLEWLTKAAENGHYKAMRTLGRLYLNDTNVNLRDPKKAFRWLELAAENGDAESAYILAEQFYAPEKTEDKIQFLKWMTIAHESGYVEASFQLGFHYYKKAEFEMCIKYFQEASKKGHVEASIHHARCYLDGLGVKQDAVKGFNALLPLMNLHPNAIFNVVYCYLEGLGTAKNINKAKELLQNLQDQSENVAVVKSNLLILCDTYDYIDRKDFSENYIKSLKQLEGLALEKNPLASRQLGEIYQKGLGITADHAIALKWFKVGIDLKDPEAFFEFGRCYEFGIGTTIDLTNAVTLYEAAEKGYDKRAAIRKIILLMNENMKKNKPVKKYYLELQNFAQKDYEEARIQVAICYLKNLVIKHSSKENLKKGFDYLRKFSEEAIKRDYLKLNFLSNITNSTEKKACLESVQKAFLELGICYQQGIGTTINLEQASVWFNQAAALNTFHKEQCELAKKLSRGLSHTKNTIGEQNNQKLEENQRPKKKQRSEKKQEPKQEPRSVVVAGSEQKQILEIKTTQKIKAEKEVSVATRTDIEPMSNTLDTLKIKLEAGKESLAIPIENSAETKVVKVLNPQASDTYTVTPLMENSQPLYFINNRLYRGSQPYFASPEQSFGYNTYQLQSDQPYQKYGYFLYQRIGYRDNPGNDRTNAARNNSL